MNQRLLGQKCSGYYLLLVAITFLLCPYLLEASKQNRNYRVTYDIETNEEVARETENIQCWQFTWAGAKDENNDTTMSCDFVTEQGIPCFEPIVYTIGDNWNNGPNLTQIDEYCKEGNTLSGEPCIPYCDKGTGSCIQVTLQRTDKDQTIAFQSHFCGEGLSDGEIIEKGCHYQKPSESQPIRKEACFCQGDKCNSSQNLKFRWSPVIIVVLLGSLLLT